ILFHFLLPLSPFLKLYTASFFSSKPDLHPAAQLMDRIPQFLPKDLISLFTGTVPGIDTDLSQTSYPLRQIPHIFRSLVIQVESSQYGKNLSVRERLPHLTDDEIRPGVRAAAENHQSFRKLKHKALFMFKTVCDPIFSHLQADRKSVE